MAIAFLFSQEPFRYEGTPIVENDYIIENVTETTTIATSVVKMYTFTIVKPEKSINKWQRQ